MPSYLSFAARVIQIRQKLKNNWERYHLLSYGYCLFVLAFYIADHERLYKDAFYYLIVLPFIIFAGRDVFQHIKGSLVFRLCGFWLGYLVLSLLWSPNLAPRDAFDVVRAFVLIHLLLAITIHISCQDPHFLRRLFVALGAGSGIMAMVTIVRFYADHDFLGDRLAGFGRIFNSNDIARLYGFAALTTYFGLVRGGGRRSETIVYVVILTTLVGAVALTGSRGPALGLAVAVLAAAAAMRDWKLALAVLLPGLILAGAAIMGDADSLAVLRQGSGRRLEIWSIVWEWIVEKPWIGFGVLADRTVPYSGGVAIHPHQLFLSNQLIGGLPATGLLLLTLAAAGRIAYRRFLSDGNFVLAALLIFVVVAGMFDFGDLLVTINWVWLIFWVPIALICGDEAIAQARRRTSPSTASLAEPGL